MIHYNQDVKVEKGGAENNKRSTSVLFISSRRSTWKNGNMGEKRKESQKDNDRSMYGIWVHV